ncbi:LysR family transcriptional regulator [Roseateles amylovorans]|uniref:LysR family transcriptional regulator n=1 Tax=Roseateles amylovorans TaxID=2978473 RepID=A0ABY6BBY4_9BURK|nr:LysR family transcriptional regulator [Roseateles amylovorans]UXH80707.1 LysR family transcriptional regulator [Roseateles amylovorans]
MDRLDAMALLLDTLDAGSFSAAARLRGIPVATLTRHIGQLEQQLGADLLIRSTRRLTLTEAGQRYVASARQVLMQVDEMERDAAGEFVAPTGRLVISAPRAFGRLHLLPLVREFLLQHEGIQVDLQLADHHVDLVGGAADLALRIGTLPDSGLIATRLGTMRSVIAASPALLAQWGPVNQPEDLAPWPEVAVDIPLPTLATRGAGVGQERFGRQVRLTVSGAEAAADAAQSGIGFVRLLHYQVADAVQAARLVLLLTASESAPVPVHFVHAPLTQLPLKTRRFLDFASDRLRDALRALARIGAPG